MIEYAWLIPVAPFLAFPISLFFGKKTWNQGAGIGIIASTIALVLSVLVSIDVIVYGVTLDKDYLNWIALEGYDLSIGILVDQLTVVMLLVVSLIGLLVNVYSIAYMHGEEGLPRYYAEISLFIGSMLTLVLSNNLLLLYIGWELVGLCSYLLIGFWYKRQDAASASKKAFITTRFGDAFMLAGIALIFAHYHTLNIRKIIDYILVEPNLWLITIIGVLLFLGAVGKSAQIPLLGWLWDAMAGPTTVSCLIHSATMVKAGVYLVARIYPLFAASPITLTVIAYTGGITAFVAATMAFAAWDIKKILAFSTISQLGYMIMGLGVGGYAASIFHLLSHSMFKALLFLGAGSVIHAVGSNDIRKMGGLLKPMKITAYTMLIGALSLSGIPPFSGFFSKDLVIEAAYHAGDYFLYYLSVITAMMTAFYIFRLWFYTFMGDLRSNVHPHEAPKVMTVPLMILATGATIVGFFEYFGFLEFITEPFIEYPIHMSHEGFLETAIGAIGFTFSRTLPAIPEFIVPVFTLPFVLIGLGISTAIYYKHSISPEVITRYKFGKVLYHILESRYGVDWFYNFIAEKVAYGVFSKALMAVEYYVIDGIVNAIGKASILLAVFSDLFDRYVIDGIVNGIGKVSMAIGDRVRRIQTGIVQNYISLVAVGILLLLLIIGYLPQIMMFLGL